MKFVLDVFPLVVSVGARTQTEAEFDEMVAGFDRLFERGDRYALINHTPDGAEVPNARARKRIADWADSPRVRSFSKKLCVGSATIVQSQLARGALTAIMWLWKPVAPHKIVTNPVDAVEWCLDRLTAENVPMTFTRGEAMTKLESKAFGRTATRP